MMIVLQSEEAYSGRPGELVPPGKIQATLLRGGTEGHLPRSRSTGTTEKLPRTEEKNRRRNQSSTQGAGPMEKQGVSHRNNIAPH